MTVQLAQAFCCEAVLVTLCVTSQRHTTLLCGHLYICLWDMWLLMIQRTIFNISIMMITGRRYEAMAWLCRPVSDVCQCICPSRNMGGSMTIVLNTGLLNGKILALCACLYFCEHCQWRGYEMTLFGVKEVVGYKTAFGLSISPSCCKNINFDKAEELGHFGVSCETEQSCCIYHRTTFVFGVLGCMSTQEDG